jgi:hypothetical protein
MIRSDSAECRHCHAALAPEALRAAAADQERVERAIRQANQQKFAGLVALLFVGLQIYICLIADRVPLYWFVSQIAPPLARFAALKWIREYGALQTDEPDYPEARTAMSRVMVLWAGVFVVQILLLAAFGLRILF